MRRRFAAVIEGGEFEFVSTAPSECGKDERVGDFRVLWKQAAVEVRADGVVASGAFRSIFVVVARPYAHAAERFLLRSQVRSSPVILETHHFSQRSFQHHVADATIGYRPGVSRLEVEHADPWDDRALVIDVTVAEQLEPAIQDALGEGGFVELEHVRHLPGMTRAVLRTLRKIWSADVDLSAAGRDGQRRIAEMSRLGSFRNTTRSACSPARSVPI